MRKFILVLISIFLLSSSFALGFFVKNFIDDKKYDNPLSKKENVKNQNFTMKERLNSKQKELEEERQKSREEYKSEPKHPIDKAEFKCIENSIHSYEIRKCVYEANEKWAKEIDKYMKLLEKETTSEQYKKIQDSQFLWIKQNKKDNEIITDLVFNHEGTMYYDIASTLYLDLTKKRAKMLKAIYDIHTDNDFE